MAYEQKMLAKRFQGMRRSKGMFVLPGVWDTGSARVFEKQGFMALTTSSAGVAYSLGFPDGEGIAFDDLLACVEKIVRRVTVPLSYAKANAFFST